MWPAMRPVLTLMADSDAPALHPLLAAALEARGRVWGERNAEVLRSIRGGRIPAHCHVMSGGTSKEGWRSLGDGGYCRVVPDNAEMVA